MLTLRPLRESDERSFLIAYDSFKKSDPTAFFAFDFDRTKPFVDYVAKMDDWQKGRQLPTTHVPCTFMIAELGGQIIGRTSIRHTLNDYLQLVGGHIGYAVVAEFRKLGYGTDILRHSLSIARGIGLSRVLITCDEDNVASFRIIEKHRGVLENKIADPGTNVVKRRYWIDLNS